MGKNGIIWVALALVVVWYLSQRAEHVIKTAGKTQRDAYSGVINSGAAGLSSIISAVGSWWNSSGSSSSSTTKASSSSYGGDSLISPSWASSDDSDDDPIVGIYGLDY